MLALESLEYSRILEPYPHLSIKYLMVTALEQRVALNKAVLKDPATLETLKTLQTLPGKQRDHWPPLSPLMISDHKMESHVL